MPMLTAPEKPTSHAVARRLPVGAECLPDDGVHFRVWAPAARRVEVVFTDGDAVPLVAEGEGYFSGIALDAGPGSRYRLRLDGDGEGYPDPASRFQPEGPHGPSEVVHPSAFAWSDAGWKGVPRDGQVLYEMHVGTFTPEGTWAAAAEQLPELAELGVTVVEVMPVADFPGQFGWGYDGVNMFAPTRLYGSPDDFRRFVDRAHALGVGVILDVVYNHFGPDGNFMKSFAPAYFSEKHKTDWGEAINFDGADSGPVREYFIANAGYWIDEFHLDGLRLDATQDIYDDSPNHILADIACHTRRVAGRPIILVAENEPQHTRLVRAPEDGGIGLDMLWNDDFHHSAMVAMTGRNEAYYTDYLGRPQEFISALKYGYLYQGQHYQWQKKRRGTYARGTPPAAFVTFTQNHDQIANSGRGQRCHELTDPGRYKAMTALMLLGPGTPMLFQGQEFAASSPFFYFADHTPELAELVHKGRTEFLSQFRSLAHPDMLAMIPAPADSDTFARSKLNFEDRVKNAGLYEMTRDLLRIRRTEPVFRHPAAARFDGAVLAAEAFCLRWFGDSPAGDRLLVVNLGRDLHLTPAPEPLLAPPTHDGWEVQWTSEDVRYGACGTAPLETDEGWRVPGHSAVLLRPTGEATAP